MTMEGPGADAHQIRQLGSAKLLLAQDLLEKSPGKFPAGLEEGDSLDQGLFRQGIRQPRNKRMGENRRFGQGKAFLDLIAQGRLVLPHPEDIRDPRLHRCNHIGKVGDREEGDPLRIGLEILDGGLE